MDKGKMKDSKNVRWLASITTLVDYIITNGAVPEMGTDEYKLAREIQRSYEKLDDKHKYIIDTNLPFLNCLGSININATNYLDILNSGVLDTDSCDVAKDKRYNNLMLIMGEMDRLSKEEKDFKEYSDSEPEHYCDEELVYYDVSDDVREKFEDIFVLICKCSECGRIGLQTIRSKEV